MKPTLGRIVHYKSKVGDGIVSPAMVLRTQETTDLGVLEKWLTPADSVSGQGRPAELVPELTSEMHVDLLVHGLGGDYRVFNVPFDTIGNGPANSWSWPPRT